MGADPGPLNPLYRQTHNRRVLFSPVHTGLFIEWSKTMERKLNPLFMKINKSFSLSHRNLERHLPPISSSVAVCFESIQPQTSKKNKNKNKNKDEEKIKRRRSNWIWHEMNTREGSRGPWSGISSAAGHTMGRSLFSTRSLPQTNKKNNKISCVRN